MNTTINTNTQYMYQNTNKKSNEEVQNTIDELSERNSYKRELGEVSFEIKFYEDLNPKEISYKDYKSLNIDALNTMFGKGSEKWEEAARLINTTSLTEDDTLNEVFFERELESMGSSNTPNTAHIMLTMLELTPSDVNSRYIVKGFDSENFMENMRKGIMPEVVRKETEPAIYTKDKLFADFERYKELHSGKEENRMLTFTYKDIFDAMDKIKDRYEEKIAQQQALIEQLTRNNKPNPISDLKEDVI